MINNYKDVIMRYIKIIFFFFIGFCVTGCESLSYNRGSKIDAKAYQYFKRYLLQHGYSQINFDPESNYEIICRLVGYKLEDYKNAEPICKNIVIDGFIKGYRLYITTKPEDPNICTWYVFEHNKKIYRFIKINYMLEYIDILKEQKIDEYGEIIKDAKVKIFY